MKKAKLLAVATALLCLFNPLFSQSDSSYFDLGRTQLSKQLTQNITIKGSDLERMPFTNIADALRVWFNGNYLYASSTLYVVDGILITDANTISIYDIEEITLMQNALSLTNGNGHHKHLVLVKTRRNREGKNGLAVAGQTFLVKSDFDNSLMGNDLSSETGLYHQYQLSGWHNGKNIRAGVTANYLRDVYPNPKADTLTTSTPFNFDRFRINGWMTANLGSKHQLTVSMNYVPDIADRVEKNSIPSFSENSGRVKIRQTILNPSLHFHSALTNKWSNEIKASLLTFKSEGHNQYKNQIYVGAPNTVETNQVFNSKVTNLSIQDHVSYRAKLGNWTIEPALNFQFRYLKFNADYFYNSISSSSPIGNSSAMYTAGKGNLFFLTPSFRLQNRDIFNLQAGVLANVSKNKGYNSKRVFPFVTGTIDLLKLFNPGNNYSLQLFGSYAEADDYGEQPMELTDYSSAHMANFSIAIPTAYFAPYPIFPNPSYSTVNKFLQAGAQFSLPGNKVTIGYNYDNREYYDLAVVTMPVFGGGLGTVLVNIQTKSNYHRIGLTGKILESGLVEWTSSLNTTTAKIKLDLNSTGPVPILGAGLLNYGEAWTGGWANRFRYKNFLAGTNLLYTIDETRQTGFASFTKVNLFQLQNIYAGYRWQSARLKNIEIVASFKNPWQNENASTAYNRKYYGLGFKAQL